MTFIWLLLGIAYFMCLIFLGVATFRRGHYVLFMVGFFLPILWILGALIRPTARASARFASPA